MSVKHDELNDTELVELCRQQLIFNAHRGLGRETLLGLLDGTISEEECPPDPIDEDRDFMQYMQSHHGSSILGQLRCGDEGYFCPDCPTGRVVVCTVIDCEPSMRKSMFHEMLLERQRRGK